jgi:hypothetical protein
MRLRTILLAMMLVCTLMMQAADKAWFLVTDKGEAVELSKFSYLLAASSETFDIVCVDSKTISGVAGVSLEEREVTGIKALKAGDAMFSQMVGDELTISNAKAGTTMQVLSLSGIVYTNQTLKDGKNVINVSQLQSGTYLLKVGETSVKFIKK